MNEMVKIIIGILLAVPTWLLVTELFGDVWWRVPCAAIAYFLGLCVVEFFNDNDTQTNESENGEDEDELNSQADAQATFFTLTFIVMGHISKADGRVCPDEIAHAKQVMAHLQLDAENTAQAQAIFKQGTKPEFDLDTTIEQLRTEYAQRNTLLQIFLEIQVQAALADGVLHARENRVLRKISEALHVSADDLELLIERLRAGELDADTDMSLATAYRVIGVDASTPFAKIRKRYNHLRGQYHPDKLEAKNLPPDIMRFANTKSHQIRVAWERIQRG